MNIYDKSLTAKTRWVSFENSTGGRGEAARANQGAKGYPCDQLKAGETRTLLDIKGSGEIRRIWLTTSDRSPEILRSLRLDMYWDGYDVPSVSCPLGDFFGVGLGRRCAFECQLFSDPQGKSFNCFIPMPFRKQARITLSNESLMLLTHIFYDINLLMDEEHSDRMLYFHAHWRRESPNELGREYTVLPKVRGCGRFLGCNVGVIRNPVYADTWWGEGEFKVWYGDDDHPTLCGTGTEDYIGTAWGIGAFANRTQGCPVADAERGQWAFYRYHIDDPIYFDDACHVAIQTIGGHDKQVVLGLLKKGAPLIPVSLGPVRLLDKKRRVDLSAPDGPEGWCNFWRQDDWSSTAYFYLDSPGSGLPEISSVETRCRGLMCPD